LSAFGFGYDSSGVKVLAEDFDIGDTGFPEGAAFAGDMDVKLTGLAYTWLFHHSEESAAGIGIGAVQYDVSADLAAVALLEGEMIGYEERFSEDAWAPMLRAEYMRSLAAHWRVGADVSYVRKSRGAVSGDAIDVNLRVEYFPWKHFGFSLRYNYNDIDLDFRRSRFDAEIDLKSRGPQLVATYRF
jgi:hypothetical protein